MIQFHLCLFFKEVLGTSTTKLLDKKLPTFLWLDWYPTFKTTEKFANVSPLSRQSSTRRSQAEVEEKTEEVEFEPDPLVAGPKTWKFQPFAVRSFPSTNVHPLKKQRFPVALTKMGTNSYVFQGVLFFFVWFGLFPFLGW